ncbi:hypothetical protein NBRC116584_30130 [Hydrogenophaga sp. 5NK40-0174]
MQGVTMKKRWVSLIAVGSLALGVGGATWFWNHFYSQFIHFSFVTRTEADIITRVAVLEHIRAGQIADATALLESQLDGDLIGAGALARDGTKFKAKTGRAVALEARARAESGYRPIGSDVNNAVQEALRLVPAAVADATVQPVAPEGRSAGKKASGS